MSDNDDGGGKKAPADSGGTKEKPTPEENPPQANSQPTCPICLEILKDPRTLNNCMHTFCYLCIAKVLESRGGYTAQCPLCKKHFNHSNIKVCYVLKEYCPQAFEEPSPAIPGPIPAPPSPPSPDNYLWPINIDDDDSDVDVYIDSPTPVGLSLHPPGPKAGPQPFPYGLPKATPKSRPPHRPKAAPKVLPAPQPPTLMSTNDYVGLIYVDETKFPRNHQNSRGSNHRLMLPIQI